MIKIAICDDEAPAREMCAQLCRDVIGGMTDEPLSLLSFDNPVDFLEDFHKHAPIDLILCDIYMPGLLGTEAIKELREKDENCHVIFLTTSVDHAIDAFALHADGYLVKPCSRQQFADAVAPVIKDVMSSRKAHLSLKTKDSFCRVDFSEILYCETSGHDQLVHLRDGKELVSRLSSNALFSQLSGDSRFFKAGSSYIVNLDAVRSINGFDVEMVDGSTLPVPVRLKKKLSDAFFDRSFEVDF